MSGGKYVNSEHLVHCFIDQLHVSKAAHRTWHLVLRMKHWNAVRMEILFLPSPGRKMVSGLMKWTKSLKLKRKFSAWNFNCGLSKFHGFTGRNLRYFAEVCWHEIEFSELIEISDRDWKKKKKKWRHILKILPIVWVVILIEGCDVFVLYRITVKNSVTWTFSAFLNFFTKMIIALFPLNKFIWNFRSV